MSQDICKFNYKMNPINCRAQLKYSEGNIISNSAKLGHQINTFESELRYGRASQIDVKMIKIFLIIVMLILMLPFAQGACNGVWPYCCTGCTANDVTITRIWLTSDTVCQPGQTGTATLWARFHVSTSGDRYCAYSLIKVLQPDGITWKNVEYRFGNINTAGDYDRAISQIAYICGNPLNVKDIYAAWHTKATDPSACPYSNCGDYIPSKCYYDATVRYIQTPIVADFSYPDLCAGSPAQFTDKTTGGTLPYTYSWNFGDGGSSILQNPIHTYTSSGYYTVTLTVTDSQAMPYTSTKSYIVHVWPAKPTVTIEATIT